MLTRRVSSASTRSLAVLGVMAAALLAGGEDRAIAAEKRLFNFSPNERNWVAVNDGVMGGVSSGSIVTKNGVATFSGRVRLENNGGFSSARSSAAVASLPVSATSFALRLRGDGAIYQFTVDTDEGWFWAPIRPKKNAWSTVVVEFDDLVPVTRFGEQEDRDGFDGSEELVALGLLISNKKAERFALSIDWISANEP
jgi:NADH dehydrogenase [ubiquinone] 1 alpha subcomplex assembly factor 1